MIDKFERMIAKYKMTAKFFALIEYLMLPFLNAANKKVNDAIKSYCDANQKENLKYIRKLKKDILYSRLYYNITPKQYFLFDFEKLSDVGRKEFVGDREKVLYTDNLHKTSDVYKIFRNKINSYETFKKYYHRDVIEINEKVKFCSFAKEHTKFILKASDSALGEGIEIYNAEQAVESIEELYDRFSTKGNYIAEELIIQSGEMRDLHPSSVNTVRIATYLKEDHVMHMFSFLRMGTGGGVIDNATAGGISAAIDMETGIVKTPGWREDLTTYLKHPDTGAQIIGMQIPKWDELLNLVDELAHVVPEQKYVGWDLALTDSGWVMVEGNDSAMMTAIQMCERRGLRDTFDAAFKES